MHIFKYNDQNGALPTCKGEGEVIKTMSRKVYETAFSITSLKRLSAGNNLQVFKNQKCNKQKYLCLIEIGNQWTNH